MSNFYSSLQLHPYFKYASKEGSGESAQACADSPEPSLLCDAISTKNTWAGLIIFVVNPISDLSVFGTSNQLLME